MHKHTAGGHLQKNCFTIIHLRRNLQLTTRKRKFQEYHCQILLAIFASEQTHQTHFRTGLTNINPWNRIGAAGCGDTTARHPGVENELFIFITGASNNCLSLIGAVMTKKSSVLRTKHYVDDNEFDESRI